MNKKDLRIVFMGTPDFAVESLRILVENQYNIAGVITMPDKPSGRGHKIQHSAVKKYALEHNLPLLQPERLKDEAFLKELKAWNADLQIVVAFRMLPEVVWNMPRLGTFNLHGSLLPQYRGAAPINWAIINGEKETGVTTFFLTHEIDTGKIILQDKVKIEENDNVGKIHDELMHLGARLVKETVDLILEDKVEAIDQSKFYVDEQALKPAPKIFKETCRIDWNKSAEQIHNHIRGLSPYPAAWTELYQLGEKPIIIKIYAGKVNDSDNKIKAGTLIVQNNNKLIIGTGLNNYEITEIHFPNKSKIRVSELLNGRVFYVNDSFIIKDKHIDYFILNGLFNLKRKRRRFRIIIDNLLKDFNLLNSDNKRISLFKDEIERRILTISKKGSRYEYIQKLYLNNNSEVYYTISKKGKTRLDNLYKDKFRCKK